MGKHNFLFLHIIEFKGEYSDNIIDFIQDNYCSKEHLFILFDYSIEKYKGDNIFYMSSKFGITNIKNLLMFFNKVDRIIFHGIFLKKYWMLLFYIIRYFDYKFVWIPDGHDLFSWERKVNVTDSYFIKLRKKFANYLERNFRSRILYFGSYYKGYRDFWEKSINSHGRAFDIVSLYRKINKNIVIENTTHNKNIHIMIGVNANPLNNHVEILRSLVKFRYSNNIKIYLNLSCVDEFEKNIYKKYIDDVIECGNLLFGEKISIIDEKILDENYITLMGYMDVVVSKIKSGALHESYTYDCLLKTIELRKVLFLYEKSSIYNNLKQKYNVRSIQNELNLPNLVHLKANTGFDEYKDEYKIEDLNLWNIMFNALKSEFQKIKFLHIIRPSKELSLPIIKMIYDNFDNQSHRFLVNRRTSLYSCTDFMSIPIVDLFLIGNSRFDRFLYFYRRLNSAEYIIWHGLYIGYGNPILSVKEFIFLSIFPCILKKIAWVAWGRDLYDWKYKRRCNIFLKIVNFIGYQLRNNIPYYISIFLPDADEFKKQFGHHRNVFDASYSNSDFIKIAEDAKPNEKYFLRSRPLRIMVGHNANVWGGHIELLNSLAQYRYENIRIYIILSTGIDKNYLIKVKEYAKLLFGKKAICIMRKMPLSKYVNFLWKMDIAVFNLRDQAGLGNLMNLFYMRKKVFLPEDGLLFKFFVSQGLNVSSTNKIKDMDFERFAHINKNKEIPKYILDRVDLKTNIKKWQYIFESIENKKGEIDDGKI